jgi:copper oxidase (laccase) domain-containing protein
VDWAKHNLKQDGAIVRPVAWQQYDWLVAGYSLRSAGNMSYAYDEDQSVYKSRAALSAKLGTTVGSWVCMRQIHSNKIETVTGSDAGKGSLRLETGISETDGMITGDPGILLTVLVADCVPLLMIDSVSRRIGAFHAGRKVTVLGVATEAVRAMVAAGSQPENLKAVIGPSIGPASYEVDLWNTNEQQLRAAKVGTVIRTDLDTATYLDLFFSHRADPEHEGRFIGFIGLRA